MGGRRRSVNSFALAPASLRDINWSARAHFTGAYGVNVQTIVGVGRGQMISGIPPPRFTGGVQIDGKWSAGHIFSNLPIHLHTHVEAGGTVAENERLIAVADDPHKQQRVVSCEERVPRVMCAVAAVICTVGLGVCLAGAVILMTRIDRSLATVDQAVSFHKSATSMIRNVDSLLNSSAALAATVHKLGVKSLEATTFSTPFLNQMLNTTASVLTDIHRVVEHPIIQIG